jgi:hypothetical protein
MERMWAASHPSQKAIPRTSPACPEPEQETRQVTAKPSMFC